MKRIACRNGLFDESDEAAMTHVDPSTREQLARVVAATLAAGYRAFVTIDNKAEGSAPLSVIALAREVLRQTAA